VTGRPVMPAVARSAISCRWYDPQGAARAQSRPSRPRRWAPRRDPRDRRSCRGRRERGVACRGRACGSRAGPPRASARLAGAAGFICCVELGGTTSTGHTAFRTSACDVPPTTSVRIGPSPREPHTSRPKSADAAAKASEGSPDRISPPADRPAETESRPGHASSIALRPRSAHGDGDADGRPRASIWRVGLDR
jgi:hypothetical protein